MSEQRRFVRRKTDRQLMKTVDHQQAMLDRLGARDAKKAEHERRRFLRHKCKVRIEMLVGNGAREDDEAACNAIKVHGHIEDLSIDGALLTTKHAFDTKQALHLTVIFPDETQIFAKARVRWVKHDADKGDYASGVEFLQVSDDDQGRLLAFFKEINCVSIE